jgi:urease accessory protein
MLAPQLANAHLVSTRFGEFYGGLIHPLTALDHLVPWLAMGLLGGLQSSDAARRALLLFPVAVCAGAIIGSLLPEPSWVGNLNLLSFAVLGVMVVLATYLKAPQFLAIVVLFGISHGYANGVTELSGSDLILYLSGVVCAAYILICLVTAGTHYLIQQQQWGTIAVRAAGSWITAIGVMYLGITLAGPLQI